MYIVLANHDVVCTPENAIMIFKESKLDYLAIGNCMVTNDNNLI